MATRPGNGSSSFASPRAGKNLKSDNSLDDEDFFKAEELKAHEDDVMCRLRLSNKSQNIVDQTYPDIFIVENGLVAMKRLLEVIQPIYKVCSKKEQNLPLEVKTFLQVLNEIENSMVENLRKMTSTKQVEQLEQEVKAGTLSTVEILLGEKSAGFKICQKSSSVVLSEKLNVLQGIVEKKTLGYLTTSLREGQRVSGDWCNVEPADVQKLREISRPPELPSFYKARTTWPLKSLCASLTSPSSALVHAVLNDSDLPTRNHGVGKTMLAIAAANDESVRNRFDNILWLSMHQKMSKRTLLRQISEQVCALSFHSRVEVSAILNRLSTEFIKQESKVLVVLDGVYAVHGILDFVHNVASGLNRLKILCTVQGSCSNFVRQMQFPSIKTYTVTTMSDDETFSWLSQWSGGNGKGDSKALQANANVKKIALLTENLPSAVNSIGARFNAATGESSGFKWDTLAKDVSAINALEASSFYDDGDENEHTGLLLSILKVYISTTKALEPNLRKLLTLLGVFPLGIRIPQRAIAMLWQIETDEAKDVIVDLQNRSHIRVCRASEGVCSVEIDPVFHNFLIGSFERQRTNSGQGGDTASVMAALMLSSVPYIETSDSSKVSSLVIAAMKALRWSLDMGAKSSDIIGRLKIKIGDDVFNSTYGPRKMTCLHVLAESDFLPDIKKLNGLGLNTKRLNGEGLSILELAGLNGRLESVANLVQFEGFELDSIGADDGLTPLLRAAQKGHVETVKCLLCAGANVEIQTSHQETSLFLAAEAGNVKVVKVLLEWKAGSDIPHENGETPLCAAAKAGHTEIVKSLILGRKANVNQQTNEGATPMWLAARGNHTDVCKLLLENDAQLKLQHKDGSTPLWIAASSGNIEIVKLLHSAGASLNTPNEDGTTPLFAAEANGREPTAELLRSLGANN
jgi:ankyrin repeat protein